LVELGKKFEKEMGVPVKVETQEGITDKFQAAASGGKGPDVFFWANDRIGEWADAGLLKPLRIREDFKAAFLPMAWEAVTHRKRVWGYPLALECVSLICNKKLVAGKPPTQLSEFPAFAKELKAKDPKLIAIMWEYKSPYFSFPFLASAGAYSFKKTESGYVQVNGLDMYYEIHGTGQSLVLLHGAFSAIGIATFGPVDPRPSSPTFGQLLATPKSGWSATNLVAPFGQLLGCPVAIDTDVNAAALAEALHGAGRGCGTVVYVTVGTGIGGGIAVDGRTLKGTLHPEMGHIRVARHERDVAFAGTCPFHADCVEGLASGPAIIARYGTSLDRLPPEHEALGIVGYYLGQLAASILLMLSPERVVFGGGVMNYEPLLREVRAAAAKILNGYAGLGAEAASLDGLIVAPGLGDRSGIFGAIALAQAMLRSANR
jgi:fructokinase